MLSPVYGYAWKGKTAVPARWQKPSMVSAISPRGEIPSEIVEGGIKTAQGIFSAVLIAGAPRNIALLSVWVS
jgi:hypothetical protein